MTNGFNLNKVITALYGRIGWRQPAAATAPKITDANKTARSGRYYQDFHSLVSIDNVRTTMEEPSASDVNLNAHLDAISKAAIMRTLAGVFTEKEYIERIIVSEPLQNQPVRTIANTGKFVGFEISIARTSDISQQIHAVHLRFDADATFNVYLFAEGKKSPILTKSVTTVAEETTIITLDEQTINFVHDNYQGSRFYIGYFQDDLAGAKAIQQDVCFAMSKTFRARPFEAAKIDELNFDRSQISWTNQSYGMNLEISAFRDYTDHIIKSPAIFDEAIGLTMAYMVIEQILNTAQSNATERLLKDQLQKVGIQLDLQGYAAISDSPRVTGLAQKIEKKYKVIKSSLYPQPKAKIVNHGS
jgi:hypothetical protein